MASFTFSPHQMVRTPSMSVPHPQQLLQRAEAPDASHGVGVDPVAPTQDPVPLQPTVAPAPTQFSNPQYAQAAMFANAQTLQPTPQPAAPKILRRADAPEPYHPQTPPPQMGYVDEFFDLSGLPDSPPAQIQSGPAANAYDKTRGLFGAPNQKFGRY